VDFRNSVNTSRELALITTYPALFVSHGAPDIVISGHPAATALRDLGQQFAAPRAILMISAHWLTDPVTITCGEAPETIHDFGGFPKPLYQIQYPAMGDSRLATEIAGRLETVGIAVRLDRHRGLDHGAWTPLLLMYPDANVPVVQISLPASDLDACARLGEALAPLRKKGILIIGSGGSVHNLRRLNSLDITEPWALAFENWLLETVEGNRFDRLSTAADLPSEFSQAHPSIEHFLPLIVAWCAGGSSNPARRIHHSFSYGNLGMSMFQFD
jgi:4,5-DOPA dioxygenase extradiol